ncbi:hypothetical protein T459_31019 [Capsicum annuum]|uniref:Uncharacterized protein n=1 Tax=Capsicum annuum TaxID=4072 RepID=A0A2G2YA37_CAPAN|nr:hypothetical protein T459_31019 [Capsicum annuum]
MMIHPHSGISQIEIQKGVPASNQVLGFTPGNFDYTELGFSENRSKKRNYPERLNILRQAFAVQDSNIQMDDWKEIEYIPKSSLEKNVNLIVKKRLSHNARIGSAHNINVVDMIKEVLKDEGIRIFRSTCFESFLDLLSCNFQGSIARCLMTLEVQHSYQDQLRVLVNNTVVMPRNLGYDIDHDFDELLIPKP